MKSRRVVQVMAIGLVICSMVVFAAGAKSSGDPNATRLQEINERRMGGGGGRVSGQHVSGERPKQASAKLVTGAKTARRAMGVNRHVMAAPEKFPKDGVYIWCDPDGLWTMFWKGRQSLTVNATVTVGKPITVKAAVKATTSKVGGNQLKITNTSKARAGIVQFTSASDSVQLNILLNGKIVLNRTYVGSRLTHPTQFPLKLATRRTLSRKKMPNKELARIQESLGHTVLDGLSTGRSKKTPITVVPSHKSSGGGGNKGGKAKR